MKNIAVFIDRDGTMGANPHIEYPTQFKPFSNLNELIETLKKKGYLVIAITNQSCIARKKDNGYNFDDEFSGYGLDDWFICPHDSDDNCNCRKPRPGLIIEAQKKHNINMELSFMIGDRYTDVDAGAFCGAKTILVLTGNGKKEFDSFKDKKADFVADDLQHAVDIILST